MFNLFRRRRYFFVGYVLDHKVGTTHGHLVVSGFKFPKGSELKHFAKNATTREVTNVGIVSISEISKKQQERLKL